jgi:hypothetical protein
MIGGASQLAVRKSNQGNIAAGCRKCAPRSPEAATAALVQAESAPPRANTICAAGRFALRLAR